MPHVHAEVTSPRSVDEVWSVIGDFYAVHTWHPVVKDTYRDATRPDTRLLNLGGDARVAEQLIETKPGLIRYRNLDEGPMTDFEGVIAVVPDPDGRGSIITWDATFECDESLESVMCNSMQATYQQGLDLLAD